MKTPDAAEAEDQAPKDRPNENARKMQRYPRMAHKLCRGECTKERYGNGRDDHGVVPLRLNLPELIASGCSGVEHGALSI